MSESIIKLPSRTAGRPKKDKVIQNVEEFTDSIVKEVEGKINSRCLTFKKDYITDHSREKLKQMIYSKLQKELANKIYLIYE